MAELPFVEPARIGLDAARLERVYEQLSLWTDTGEIPAVGLCVGRRAGVVAPRVFGRHSPGGRTPARPDALFLLASITKPITATTVMLLVERGRITLDDRVADFVPAFAQNGKSDVRIRHLLTHTSGLPDMTPSNERLRAEHQPLQAFLDEVCTLPLLFPTGTQVRYQSTGFAMLAEVVHQATGMLLREFLAQELFEPLGMSDTSLGLREAAKDRLTSVRISPAQQKTDWNWNSPYWLNFGAPWGGLISSPSDLARLCRMLLHSGSVDSKQILGAATVRAMTTNQLATMPLVPEDDRRCRPWGLGWRLSWPAGPESFCDLISPRAFGHWGATGTLCWIDPDADLFCIILTTQPLGGQGNYLTRLSNRVAAAAS
jgi:CubicO group peptidase (beta-lactamase class C family)